MKRHRKIGSAVVLAGIAVIALSPRVNGRLGSVTFVAGLGAVLLGFIIIDPSILGWLG